MFSRIQARYFRSLKSVDQSLGRSHALVGPNASGKTTFLDVLGLLCDMVRLRGDVRKAVMERSSSFGSLLWQGPGRDEEAFQLAVEAHIPYEVTQRMTKAKMHLNRVRYELEIGLDEDQNEIGLNHETLWLFAADSHTKQAAKREVFPHVNEHVPSLLMGKARNGFKLALKKSPGGNDNYYPEGGKSYAPSFKLGRTKLALAHVPADTVAFPVSTWFRDLLEAGVQNIMLNSQVIRQPSPPGQGLRFQPDGANLPWVVEQLRLDEKRFAQWLAHVRTALEDVVDIYSFERESDRHRYLMVKYANGAVVPSWLVSDGTLRLLALTITAYLPNMQGVFLVEEPENGIHPRAIETVAQSLSSIYEGQVLMATHSPVVLNMLTPSQVLCFAKDVTGATDIVSGNLHPALQDWKQGEPDFGVLFASGILS